MDNKFQMTREQNVFLVKRNIVDYIWKDANLEGIAVTYPDTEMIYEGLSVQGYKVKDILTINNLKHAWQFLLETLDYPLDYNYVCKMNQIVGGNNVVLQAGYIRSIPVRIGGIAWQPDVPIESQVREEINSIMEIKNPTDRAITLMLYGMRKQIFFDGNKCTSMLIANQVLISNGGGVIAVPVERKDEFLKLLIKFYESNEMGGIKEFVFDVCLDGAVFPERTENKEIQLSLRGMVINDIKKSGFEAKETLIDNMVRLSEATEAELSLRDVKELWNHKDKWPGQRPLIREIIEELKSQELRNLPTDKGNGFTPEM